MVSAVDILLSQHALPGEITFTGNQMLHADVAPLQSGAPWQDGVFNPGDLLVIGREAHGMIGFQPGLCDRQGRPARLISRVALGGRIRSTTVAFPPEPPADGDPAAGSLVIFIP